MYRLDQLGWLQFERLCSLVLEAEAGLTELEWLGHADSGRVAVVEWVARGARERISAPVTVAILWVRDHDELLERVLALRAAVGSWLEDRVLLLTNLDAEAADEALQTAPGRFTVLGCAELSAAIDRHPQVRSAMPSLLGLRDLAGVVPPGVRSHSSLELERAQALARVFWPTRAYERARRVLARHRFVVLTGPPEMGKTAIAQMLALAQLACGWEAHECNSPDQLWRVFERDRPQVFIADDAFGSTEYRPDAAERWAQALGRLLASLDERHWLIWTSRPAPLKAGLRRVQRERGSERFPAPAEVLVDASELDLAEKTLILFRHAKARGASADARRLVRSAALSIVEHPHFTPERIRRFVSDRIETLPELAPGGIVRAIERELASPTEAMRTSYRALGDEHRALLIALLDAPAGLIDERELAATLRRHHPGGLSRPPGELIDRLTDHFVRVTPLGIGWVHPSWRDLVIGELRDDPGERRRFLTACGIHGAMLALSQEGGVGGERALPLLTEDADWDLLGDRARELLLRELEDQDVARLLLAARTALDADVDPATRIEVRALVKYMLDACGRAWERRHRQLPVYLIEAWYALRVRVTGPAASPPLAATWAELRPGPLLLEELDRTELARADEWLALAQAIYRHDLSALEQLGFFEKCDRQLLERLIDSLLRSADPELRPIAESIAARIPGLLPDLAYAATLVLRKGRERQAEEERWWVPSDILVPPSNEIVATATVDFTRADVGRVLRDL